MSSLVEAQAEEIKENPRRSRRRPQSGAGGNGRRRRTAKKTGTAAVTSEGEIQPKEKKERPQSIPVPSELIGTNAVGVVSAIIRKGRLRFGFIHLCSGPEIDETVPRIYFSFSQIEDSATTVRRGYIVSFVCNADDKGRAYAAGIKLTEEGRKIAEEKEAQIALKRSEKSETTDAPARRAPRERKPLEDRPVTLKVTCEGKEGSKLIEFNFAQSVGKLKNIATTEFDAPVHFNVFQISAEHPEGVFLTKSILNSMNTNDHIHLAAPKEDSAKAGSA